MPVILLLTLVHGHMFQSLLQPGGWGAVYISVGVASGYQLTSAFLAIVETSFPTLPSYMELRKWH